MRIPRRIYLQMVEKQIEDLFVAKKINGPIHLSGGNEECLIKLFTRIKEGDWVFSTHRNHYHYLLKGGCPVKLIHEVMAGNSMHMCDRDIKFYPSAIVGGCIPIAVGVAVALKRERADARVWCFVGDGATDSGRFFEAARYADAQKLPIVFVVEDNDLSVETPVRKRWGARLPRWDKMFTRVRQYTYKRTSKHTGAKQWVTF